jgi:excisionase family DNA binding protein
MAKPRDTVLTIEELADYLKLSKSTLYHLARRGDFSDQKVGCHWRFQNVTSDRWLGERASLAKRKKKGRW